MKKFTEEEAKIETERAEEESSWFCPLVGKKCNPDCFSYQPAKMENFPDIYEEKPRYYVVLPTCKNTVVNPQGKEEVI